MTTIVSSQQRLTKTARRFIADSSGATVVEYALLTVIILGILMLMSQISGTINSAFSQLTSFIGR
jgi:Flp pilus assembly pilin Flp